MRMAALGRRRKRRRRVSSVERLVGQTANRVAYGGIGFAEDCTDEGWATADDTPNTNCAIAHRAWNKFGILNALDRY